MLTASSLSVVRPQVHVRMSETAILSTQVYRSAGRALYTLVPFSTEESRTIGQAATLAGKSERTVRSYCSIHGVGRRVAGGTWAVSRVALAMLLNGDDEALVSYRDHGVRRRYEPVARYYHELGLGHLLARPEFDR
jgi:hypothetical protein